MSKSLYREIMGPKSHPFRSLRRTASKARRTWKRWQNQYPAASFLSGLRAARQRRNEQLDRIAEGTRANTAYVRVDRREGTRVTTEFIPIKGTGYQSQAVVPDAGKRFVSRETSWAGAQSGNPEAHLGGGYTTTYADGSPRPTQAEYNRMSFAQRQESARKAGLCGAKCVDKSPCMRPVLPGNNCGIGGHGIARP